MMPTVFVRILNKNMTEYVVLGVCIGIDFWLQTHNILAQHKLKTL